MCWWPSKGGLQLKFMALPLACLFFCLNELKCNLPHVQFIVLRGCLAAQPKWCSKRPFKRVWLHQKPCFHKTVLVKQCFQLKMLFCLIGSKIKQCILTSKLKFAFNHKGIMFQKMNIWFFDCRPNMQTASNQDFWKPITFYSVHTCIFGFSLLLSEGNLSFK